MKADVLEIARQIADLDSNDISKLTTVLMNKHNISMTMYKFDGFLNDNIESNYDSTCHIVLRETGTTKLRLVKTIKEIFGLGLKEAKDFVDNAPCYLKRDVSFEEANEMKEELESAGAIIELV